MAVWIGLMSGTSLDGIDAAAVRLEGEEERPGEAGLVAFRSVAYEPPFRRRLERACRSADTDELCALDVELGRRFGRAAGELLGDGAVDPGEVAAVGSHGQTVRHRPPPPGGAGAGAGRDSGAAREGEAAGDPPCTLQLGEAAEIAEATGLPVISDFRVRDVAAGGQGAPLTPCFDRLLLADPERTRAIQNLGGMGNVTILPAADASAGPAAFDTGPGVALIDAAYRRLTGEDGFDVDGRTAARGSVREEALAWWLEDPFFDAEPPRSTGRERFGPERVEAWLSEHPATAAEDLLATLVELTARSVAGALERVPAEVDEVVLCGGGARNAELVRRIRRRVAPARVRDLSDLGWDPDAREAAAFALLARQHALGFAASVSWATGAEGPRVLGKHTPA